MDLDDLDLFRRLDPDNMLGHIDAFPDQIAAAWEHAHTLDLPAQPGEVERIVICGLGGSAISGDLLAALIGDTSPVPITVNREYDLPPYAAGPQTLVVAMSHSGTTEETLSCARQAAERGARLLAVTTGGQLDSLVRQAGGVSWTYTYHSQPRGALGWPYGMVVALASRLELVPDLSADVKETIDVLRQDRAVLGAQNPSAQNPAKRMAGQLIGRIPFIWGAGLLAPVARRWKTQLNENAKTCAFFDVLPELNHNTVVGIEFPPELLRRLALIQLISPRYEHPRVALRHQATHDLLLGEGIASDLIRAHGESRMAQQASLIQFGDYVSYYVAIAYGTDPTPIRPIDILKRRLAEVS
jgi:glucose/mannose-6-phosphate isomerase